METRTETPQEEGELSSEDEWELTSEDEGESASEDEEELASEDGEELASDGEGELGSEYEGELASEDEGELGSEDEGQLASEDEGELAYEDEGQLASEDEGPPASEDEEDPYLKDGGQLPSEGEQQPPPKGKGKQPARDDWEYFGCKFCPEVFSSKGTLGTVTIAWPNWRIHSWLTLEQHTKSAHCWACGHCPKLPPFSTVSLLQEVSVRSLSRLWRPITQKPTAPFRGPWTCRLGWELRGLCGCDSQVESMVAAGWTPVSGNSLR